LTQKIFITGGSGFIGTKLAKKILDFKEIEKIILYDIIEPPKQLLKQDIEQKIEFINGNLTDDLLLEQSMQNVHQVVHLAAIADVKKCKEDPEFSASVNVLGTKKVLESCEKNNVNRIIFASTMSAIYGNSLEFDEKIKPNPISEYGKQKLEAENMIEHFCQNNKLNGIVLRKSNLFGVGFILKPNVVNLFVKNAMENKPITINGVQTRNFLHVSDACIAYNNAIFSEIKSSFEVFNISGKETSSIKDLAYKVKEKIDKISDVPAKIVEENQVNQNSSIPIIKTDKAKEILKYEPRTDLNSGIDELINFFQNNKN